MKMEWRQLEMITWRRFKELVENAGVKDRDKISWISFAGEDEIEVRFDDRPRDYYEDFEQRNIIWEVTIWGKRVKEGEEDEESKDEEMD